ncbi:TPA: YopX family protein, partial [Streptococcus agalactiae]
DKADTHDPFYNYKDGCPDEIREIENIGNIHENPELLERLEG